MLSQWIQKFDAYTFGIVTSTESDANWKEHSSFILDIIFKFLGFQGELERTETTKIFVDTGVSF